LLREVLIKLPKHAPGFTQNFVENVHQYASFPALFQPFFSEQASFFCLEAKRPVILRDIGADGRKYEHIEVGKLPFVVCFERALRGTKEHIPLVFKIY